MTKEYLNPDKLFPSLQYGFSQAVVSSNAGKTVYLSGQVGWNAQQEMVGGHDLQAQTQQTFRNIELAMQAVGGCLTDVVSLRIYIVDEQLEHSHVISDALKHFFPADKAPATTWIGVHSLANKDFLIEIEAIAVIDK